ncbi:MAG TPA: sugar kinase [Sedimentisphaerales bacterium]
MAKVVTMGEIMLRLSTPGFERFIQTDAFDVVYGGGEANVAVSLANYGHDAYFVTKLPKHEIGQSAVNSLRRFGVDTRFIARGGERVGIYFLESGASMRPSKVIYDRDHSAIAEAKAGDFDFDAIFKDAEWFHWTGITPAISDAAAELIEQALMAAKKHGVMVSCDLNFRKKLWTAEKAQKVMRHLMQYVDVCIGNEEDAEKCLGYKAGKTDVTTGQLELAAYQNIFAAMEKQFGFKYIVTSLRESHSASDNGWSGLVYDGKEFYHSKSYDIRIVDRVGGGDAFAAGFIHGILAYQNDFKKALEFAVAASALKHTVFGDFNMVSLPEVETLMGGDASGRVQR